jgi:hypothetical protein
LWMLCLNLIRTTYNSISIDNNDDE